MATTISIAELEENYKTMKITDLMELYGIKSQRTLYKLLKEAKIPKKTIRSSDDKRVHFILEG